MDKAKTSPLLRWAGSKRAVINHLRNAAPASYEKYIEPFAGSACLFFDVGPKHAVLNDLNKDLIATYESVRSNPVTVSTHLAALPFGKEHYYRIRSQEPEGLDRFARAARFIYLNRFCFNGLYRTNKEGKFNVPFGSPRNSTVPTLSHLQECADLFQSVEFHSEDFDKAVRRVVQRGDFVYLDPPFFQTEGRVFRQYTSKPFMKNDLHRLSALLEHIDDVGATFLLSYAINSDSETFFKKWNCKQIKVQRNISGFSRCRGKTLELIASNRQLT